MPIAKEILDMFEFSRNLSKSEINYFDYTKCYILYVPSQYFMINSLHDRQEIVPASAIPLILYILSLYTFSYVFCVISKFAERANFNFKPVRLRFKLNLSKLSQ